MTDTIREPYAVLAQGFAGAGTIYCGMLDAFQSHGVPRPELVSTIGPGIGAFAPYLAGRDTERTFELFHEEITLNPVQLLFGRYDNSVFAQRSPHTLFRETLMHGSPTSYFTRPGGRDHCYTEQLDEYIEESLEEAEADLYTSTYDIDEQEPTLHRLTPSTFDEHRQEVLKRFPHFESENNVYENVYENPPFTDLLDELPDTVLLLSFEPESVPDGGMTDKQVLNTLLHMDANIEKCKQMIELHAEANGREVDVYHHRTELPIRADYAVTTKRRRAEQKVERGRESGRVAVDEYFTA